MVIFLNNNFECKVYNIDKDDSGNYFILDIIVENMYFLLVNIYGLNLDILNFYLELKNKIDFYFNI